MQADSLTEKEFWEKYWEKRPNAIEISRAINNLSANAILDVFDKYLPHIPNLSILEIGGAPGQYLAYMVRNFKYQAHSLDYSKIGNDQTTRNFQSLGLPITVYEKDLFATDLENTIPKFDIVYSLGFIEHFNDLDGVVERHMRLLKPGGILLLGVPNLAGIYKFFLKQTAPKLLSIHNLSTMNDRNWDSFEKKFHMTRIYRSYIGGFEPIAMKKLEKKTLWTLSLNFIVKVLMVIFSFRFAFLRKFNNRFWSCYLIGVYKKG